MVPSQAERPPFPPILQALPTLLFVIALAYRGALLKLSPLLRTALFVPFVLLCIIPSCIYTTYDLGGDFGIASNHFILSLTVADRLFFSSPNQFLPPSGKPQSESPWYERWWIAFKLSQSMRGAGWSWQVKGTPPLSPSLQRSRFRFILSRISHLFFFYLMIDALSTWQRNLDYFRERPQPHPLYNLPIPTQAAYTITTGMMAYFALSLLYTFASIVSVLSGGWTPNENPPLFGSFKDATSVKDFWGKTWHQCFRRPFTSPTISSFKLFPKLPQTFKISLIAIVAFLLSAAVHGFAVFASTDGTYGSGAFIFFAVQPVGLAIEQLFISRVPKVVGAAFTAAWMGFTARYFVDDMVHAGLWEINSAPFSFIKGLSKGVWWDPS